MAKPTIAPTSIMPSTPKLSTPDFSVTSSPSAANSIGVEARTVVRRMAVSIFMRALSRDRMAAAHPIADQDFASQQEEQQHPLEHAGHGDRQVHRYLSRLPADI